MRHTALLVVALAACGGPTANVVSPLGRPLHTSARLDTNVSPGAELHCGATKYVIAPEPRAYAMGTSIGARRPVIHDPVALCARIAAQR